MNVFENKKKRNLLGVVIALERAQKSAPNLKNLFSFVANDMEKVDELLHERIDSTVPLIPEISRLLIDSGGKRLRPILTLASAHLCHYQGKANIVLAAAVEMMHTATLLHDDVVDESDQRRGAPSARKIYGNINSVLVGDYLLGRAFQMMVESGSLEALDVLSHAAAVIAEGEVKQIITSHDVTTTEDDYLDVIRSKTAALFSAAAEVGAIISNKDNKHRAALRSYGTHLGVAFQVIDDALDYSGSQNMLGKNIGDDFREGKVTLPVIMAYRRGDDEARSFWQRTIGEKKYQEGDLEKALSYIQHCDALNDCAERARHHISIAKDALGLFNDTPLRNALLDAADFVINREF